MNKFVKIMVVSMVMLMILTGCQKKEMNVIDIESFDVNMSEYTGMKSVDHHFKGVTPDEMIRVIKEGGSAVFYIGYTNCINCQYSVPYIEEAAEKTDTTVYYIDPYSKEYDFFAKLDEVVETLKPILREDEKGNPTIFTPHVFAVYNGELTESIIGNEESSKNYERLMKEVQ